MRESVTFTCLRSEDSASRYRGDQVLGEIRTVRQAFEDLLDRVMTDEPEGRARRIAIIQQELASLDASEMRLRRRGSRDGEFSDMGSN